MPDALTPTRISILAALLVACAAPAAAQSIRISESVSELESRARRDSADAPAYYNVAVGYMSRQRWYDADSALQKAVQLDPQFAIAYFALGLVQGRNERHWQQLRRTGGDSAVAQETRRRLGYERKAFLLDPFVDVRLLGSVVRRGMISTGYNSAVERLAEGDYPRAYDEFERLRRYWYPNAPLDSVHPQLLWLHALAAAQTQRYSEAIAGVEALLRLSLAHEEDDSTHVVPLRTNEYRYMLAALNQRAANKTAAIAGYQEVLTNDIGNFMAHVQLARIHETDRNWTRAIAERRLAIEINPEDHVLQFDLGATLARAGQWQPAEEALLAATRMQPLYPRSWYALGITRQQLGKNSEAREAYNRFLALAPARMTNQINDTRQRLGQLP